MRSGVKKTNYNYSVTYFVHDHTYKERIQNNSNNKIKPPLVRERRLRSREPTVEQQRNP